MLIDDSGLHKSTAHPALKEYGRELWARRAYIKADARARAFKVGQGTFLGKAWILIDPILQVSIYAIVFGIILKASRGMENFIGFLIIGVVFFGMLSKGLTAGSSLVTNSKNVINTFNFPVASLVLSNNYRQFLDNIPPAVIAIILALAFQFGRPISWTIILVIPLFVLLHVFNVGVCLIVARITHQVPDLKQVVSVITRGLFFVSGVFFPISRFDFHLGLRTLIELNPYYQFLHAFRASVLDGNTPEASSWGIIGIWTTCSLIVGLVYFWRGEGTYGS